jgi:hypothetical protein
VIVSRSDIAAHDREPVVLGGEESVLAARVVADEGRHLCFAVEQALDEVTSDEAGCTRDGDAAAAP